MWRRERREIHVDLLASRSLVMIIDVLLSAIVKVCRHSNFFVIFEVNTIDLVGGLFTAWALRLLTLYSSL